MDFEHSELARRYIDLVERFVRRFGDEPTKSGVPPAAAPALIEGAARLPHLELAGLMAIPPPAASEAEPP